MTYNLFTRIANETHKNDGAPPSVFSVLHEDLSSFISRNERTLAEQLLREAKHCRIEGVITSAQQKSLRGRFNSVFR